MKQYIYTLVILLSCRMTTSAQFPGWAWANSGGGLSQDEGTKIAIDPNGNTYITGRFLSDSSVFGSITLYNTDTSALATYDVFTAKYDATGNLLWAKNVKGAKHEVSWGITADVAGNCYVTGVFQSDTIIFGNDTLINATSFNPYDFFIIKYDASGNEMWARRAGGNYYEQGLCIKAGAGGSIYVVGSFESASVTFGSYTLTNTGGADVYIAKYDTNGNVLWARSAAGTGYDYANGLATDMNGNAYVTGIFDAPIQFGSISLVPASSYMDIFIAKFDPSGNVIWAKRAGGNNVESANSVGADGNENVYVTGNFSGTMTVGPFNLGSLGLTDIFIIKFDSAGNVVWAKSGGGAGGDQSLDISVEAGGNSFIIGQFTSDTLTLSNIKLANADTAGFFADLFIASFDSSGSLLWAKREGEHYSEFGGGIAEDMNGDLHISGTYNDVMLVLGNITLYNTILGLEVFVAKTGSSTGITEQNSFFNELNIFPNPGDGETNITSSEIIDEVEVRNIQGQLIYKARPAEKNVLLKIESAGLYFISVTSGTGTVTGKLVVWR